MFDSQPKKNPRNTVLGFKSAEAEEARTEVWPHKNMKERHLSPLQLLVSTQVSTLFFYLTTAYHRKSDYI